VRENLRSVAVFLFGFLLGFALIAAVAGVALVALVGFLVAHYLRLIYKICEILTSNTNLTYQITLDWELLATVWRLLYFLYFLRLLVLTVFGFFGGFFLL
jgi:hypothetical protein